MTDTKLVLALHAQRERIRTLQHAYKEQTELVNQLRLRNTELRSRVTKIEQSRDRWRARATAYRPTVNRLRSRVTDIRRSRDMWKHRAMRGHSG